jgi:tRNA threonylcarbamoyl adenosine modification protein (Sua5/YciO/YrdC/YwlC family)
MKIVSIHPENPQKRWIQLAAETLDRGGIIVYPTDSGYSIGCDATNIKAIQKLYQLKKPIKKYVMALMVPDIKSITDYAQVSNDAFKILKAHTPGPYTFILPALKHISRKLDVKRKEIGIRIPDHSFLNELFQEFPNPLLNTAATLSEDELYCHPDDIEKVFGKIVDLVITSGEIQINPTNIISLVDGVEVLRGEFLD